MQFRLFKNPNFLSLLMNWEKLGNIHGPRPTFQNPNVESMDELGKQMLKFKASAFFCQIYIFSLSNGPSKTMKNVFYFILKALFVL